MKERLYPKKEMDYQVVRDNFVWPAHIERLLVTGSMIAWLRPETVCDPACGDGSVLEAAYRQRPFTGAVLADISRPNIEKLEPTFPIISQTIASIEETIEAMDPVDLMVLTEILEHLEDPEAILRAARYKAHTLVASSPIGETANHNNDEHLWSFDVEGYRDMLTGTGWQPTSLIELSWPAGFYRFQIWTAR